MRPSKTAKRYSRAASRKLTRTSAVLSSYTRHSATRLTGVTVVDRSGDLPVTLDEVRAFLRVTNSVEDALIEGLILPATEIVESESGEAIMPQTIRASYEGAAAPLRRPIRPPTEIIGVTIGGDLQDPAHYEPLAGKYPSLSGAFSGDVSVLYRAGHEGGAPSVLKHAVLLTIRSEERRVGYVCRTP